MIARVGVIIMFVQVLLGAYDRPSTRSQDLYTNVCRVNIRRSDLIRKKNILSYYNNKIVHKHILYVAFVCLFFIRHFVTNEVLRIPRAVKNFNGNVT